MPTLEEAAGAGGKAGSVVKVRCCCCCCCHCTATPTRLRVQSMPQLWCARSGWVSGGFSCACRRRARTFALKPALHANLSAALMSH
eukprot:2253820-Rhodomonas_salina.1